MNGGPGPSPVPLMLTDAISPILPGTTYTGASGNVSCGPAGPLTVADLSVGVALGTLPATAGGNTVTFSFDCEVQ